MEQKYVLGVDPGTGSLGLVVRDTETEELMEQHRPFWRDRERSE